MADVFVLCIREEDKDDFIVELIKGLMSRGLTVSYAGAFYSERKDQYVFDNVTNLLFFASTYFSEAQMKSKNFTTWEEFLNDIEFEQIDAKLVIYAVMCTRRIDLKALREKHRLSFENLLNLLKDLAVELIRNSFEMEFQDFELHYPEIFKILCLDEKLFNESKDRIARGEVGASIGWESDAFYKFIRKCKQRERELKEKNPMKETLEELEQLQEEVRMECHRDPSKAEVLILNFFGSDLIDKSLEFMEHAEVVFYVDILGRTSHDNVVCFYYEEKCTGEEEVSLYFHTQRDIKGEIKRDSMKRFEMPIQGFGTLPTPSSPQIRRDEEKFSHPRDLYNPRTIKSLIDKKVMPALHPPLCDILFPVNNFMLELDPEEPETGFLSRKINLENCQTIEESLKIDSKLRKKIWIYKLRSDNQNERFYLLRAKDRKEKQWEKIVILGRLEDLYRIFISNRWYGRIYQPSFIILKFLVVLFIIFLALDILQAHPPDASGTSMFTKTIAVLLGAIFAYWALRTFVLDYLLEPIYVIMKWLSYLFLTTALLLGESTLTQKIFQIFPFFILLSIIALSSSYVSSAILYELNSLFKIFDHNDVLETENLNSQNSKADIHVLRPGRFQTIIRRNDNTEIGTDNAKNVQDDIEIFFNSYLFSRIKCIHKNTKSFPRKIVYSSGISLDRDKEELLEVLGNKEVEKLLYRKPITWGFWGAVRSFLLDKSEISQPGGPDDKYSPSDRFIYFGHWKHVIKCIGSAIPLFPQSVLFRNMIILIVLSGLVFNIFRLYGKHGAWLGNTIFSSKNPYLALFACLIIPFVWIYMSRKLKFRFWKIFLFLFFYLLLLLQPIPTVVLIMLVFLLAFLGFMRFPLLQICYLLVIWLDEKIRGNIVSIRNENGLRGTRIRKNLLVTQIFLSDPHYIEEERLYFNKQFFNEIISSAKWIKIRENPRK